MDSVQWYCFNDAAPRLGLANQRAHQASHMSNKHGIEVLRLVPRQVLR